MVLGVNDEQAEVAIRDAAGEYATCSNDELYTYVREWMSIPVSRRQVSLVMQKIRKELKDA